MHGRFVFLFDAANWMEPLMWYTGARNQYPLTENIAFIFFATNEITMSENEINIKYVQVC